MKELRQINNRLYLPVKRWLAPPAFPDDELKTRRASILDILLFTTLALVLITLIGNLLTGRLSTEIVEADVVAVAFCLVLRYSVHRGHIRWASIVLIGAFLIGITLFNASLGTIRTPTSAFYFVIVVGAGFLFDGTGLIVTTILSSLALLGLIWLENAGWLPRPDYSVTVTQWITYTALIGLTGGLTWSALQSARQALRRADREIAERKRAEVDLLKSEEKYRTIFETAVEGIFQSTREGRFITANPALAHMWGYASPPELIAHIADITHQVYVDPHRRSEFQQMIDAQERVHGFEYQVRRKDGTRMWVSENAHAVRDAQGAFLYYEGTIEDITERKRIEDENLHRTAQLEALRQTSLELTAQLDLQALLNAICERAVKLVQATTVSFYLHRPERDLLERVVFHGPALVNSASTRRRGEGLIGKVWETREPLVANDYQGWTERNTSYESEPSRAVVGIPISWGQAFLGVLTAVADPPKTFASEDVELLKLFGDHAAIAIENARLFESTKRNSDRVALLNTIARTVGSTIELDDLLETCLNQLLQVIHADSYYIGLYDPIDEAIELRIHYDAGERFPSAKIPVGKGLSSLVLKERRPLLINRLSEEMASLPIQPVITGTGRTSESWLGVPMTAGEQLIGLLAFASYQPDAFDGEDVALLSSVASQVAIAVDNAQHHAQVEDQSRRDSLTQALNHGYLLKRLDEEVEQSRLNDSTVSLIMLDIDHFKLYNDTYGHVVGDEVLRLMTQAIQMHLKKTDLVGRWGGEEFAIVLPRVLSDQARVVAERICTTLAELPLKDREGISLPKPTVSQGIAVFPFNATYAEKLVDAADKALYVAKQRGRDQIQIASINRLDTSFVSEG